MLFHVILYLGFSSRNLSIEYLFMQRIGFSFLGFALWDRSKMMRVYNGKTMGSYSKISMASLTNEPTQGCVNILERDFLPHD
jgi:hypothetical protein